MSCGWWREAFKRIPRFTLEAAREADLARYDDGKRGFGVTDALDLSEAWRQVRAMLALGALQFPDREAPPGMVDFFRAAYPAEQWESAMRSLMQEEDAERMMIGAVKCGQLPLWIAPVEGPIAERQVSANGLIEFDRESLIAGCYRPHNDTENLVYGYPLFVKRQVWESFVAGLEQEDQPSAAATATSTAKAESECRKWLIVEFTADSDKQRTKADFQSAALAKFPGRLSKRGFKRAWDAVAPDAERSKPGRKS